MSHCSTSFSHMKNSQYFIVRSLKTTGSCILLIVTATLKCLSVEFYLIAIIKLLYQHLLYVISDNLISFYVCGRCFTSSITFRCSRGKSRLMDNSGIESKHCATYQRNSSMLLHFSRFFFQASGDIFSRNPVLLVWG